MNTLPRQIIAVVVIVFLAAMLYVGTYLPYTKGTSYIQAIATAQQAHTVGEFIRDFIPSLDRSSPVGQEEIVRNLGATVGDVVAGNGQRDPSIVEPALQLFTHYADPLLSQGKGLSFAQLLLRAGQVQEAAYIVTGKIGYSDAARAYFDRGLELSPNRPEFLYSLLGDAQARGSMQDAKEIGAKILAIWPGDKTVTEVLQSLATTTPSR
jgi:tetratricopeptide (TPR) repeat protein